MSKHRYTVEVLRSGQPRPYADSRYAARVTLEWQGMSGYKDKNAPFVPWIIKENQAREYLRKIPCGFTDAEPEGWWSTRLSYLREIEPGVWEFETITPFTD